MESAVKVALNVQQKIVVKCLARHCSKFVFRSSHKRNFLKKLNFAYHCLFYIDENADNLIESDGFLQIDQKMLYEILERDELQIREEISMWNSGAKRPNEHLKYKKGAKRSLRPRSGRMHPLTRTY
ncbi:hypothetical protein niasHT_012263 [Heterodera trifolii]|uniref:BACK domain-containing protein n=1 Tax=Heterodera trifolii TaxID=157864 RepID=A0ABD2KXQ6_9BILA